MNQFQNPFMAFQNSTVQEQLALILNELRKINKRLDELDKNKTNDYLQKDDNLYML